jgi:hypothetical protein
MILLKVVQTYTLQLLEVTQTLIQDLVQKHQMMLLKVQQTVTLQTQEQLVR